MTGIIGTSSAGMGADGDMSCNPLMAGKN